MTSTNLSGLIERLGAATGPDRRLDVAIHVIVTNKGRLGDYASIDEYTNSAIQLGWNTPRATSSLDAIMAIIERELPDWQWMLDKQPKDFSCVLWDGLTWKARANSSAPTLPLACCLALLLALQSEVSHV